jgi:hypothetical protein
VAGAFVLADVQHQSFRIDSATGRKRQKKKRRR